MQMINYFKLSQGVTILVFVVLFSFDHLVVDRAPISENIALGYIHEYHQRESIHYLKGWQEIMANILTPLFIASVFVTVIIGIPVVIKLRRASKGNDA